jgi:hypothetical protein
VPEDINIIDYLQKRKCCELINWKNMSEIQITEESFKKLKAQTNLRKATGTLSVRLWVNVI